MTDSAIDEFAQTRGADDLFDDEIIPVSAEQQQAQTEVVSPEPEPEPIPAPAPTSQEERSSVEKQPPPRAETPQRGRGGDRGRGRGRGRGKPAQGLSESRFADPAYFESPPRNKAPRNKSSKPTAEPEPAPEARDVSPEKTQDGTKDQEAPKEDDKGEDLNGTDAEPQRVPAVRGDRSATGGVRKVSASRASRCSRNNILIYVLAETLRRGAEQANCRCERKRHQESGSPCARRGRPRLIPRKRTSRREETARRARKQTRHGQRARAQSPTETESPDWPRMGPRETRRRL